MRLYYGLANPHQLREYVHAVCNVLGQGLSGNAEQMLMETAAQETHCGRFRDPTPHGAGRGVFQIDKIAFDDVKVRTRPADAEKVQQQFGVDIGTVEHEWLDHSPLLSTIFCRLFYKLIPEEFPVTIEARAEYWKIRYNTVMGRGTVTEYVENAKRYANPV